jgi:hypothetical protein
MTFKCVQRLTLISHTWRWVFWSTFPEIWVMGVKITFIMCMIGQWKFPLDANHVIIWTYNKMHSGFKVHINWGIGGFHPTKRKHSHLFETSVGQFSPVGWKPESVFSSELMMRTVVRTFLAVFIRDENCLMRTGLILTFWKEFGFHGRK